MNAVCTHCGAPARPGIIVCEFCENAVDVEAAKRAIACKKCSVLNAETAQQCLKCKDWLVVQCVFCTRVSRHDLVACGSCSEPFAGAAERKSRQQMFNTAAAVAPLAGSLLGGVAGAFLGGAFGSSFGSSSGHSASSPSFSSDSSSSDSSGSAEDSSSVREMFSQSDAGQPSEGSLLDTLSESFGDDEESGGRG